MRAFRMRQRQFLAESPDAKVDRHGNSYINRNSYFYGDSHRHAYPNTYRHCDTYRYARGVLELV
jgi:hypothetical protein